MKKKSEKEGRILKRAFKSVFLAFNSFERKV